MYIPTWKRYLSYIYEIHLESTSSVYNDHLHVSLHKGRIQLSTDHAIYSFADKYKNFLHTFEQLDLPEAAAEVLILGFGLGSIPYMLEKKFDKKYNYTGVEIDEEVIYLASKYVLSELRSDIELIHADGVNYIHLNTRQYDMICVDVFIDDRIPKPLLSISYLQSLKEALTSDGVLIFNHLANTESDSNKARAYFDECFTSIFPEGRYLQILGNAMLVNV